MNVADKLSVRPLGAPLAAEIRGVDLSVAIDDATADAIRDAFHQHLVLVIPEQDLEPERQIAFTELFGPVEPHPLRTRRSVDGHPGVLILENRPGVPGARNDYWHSDISHAERPPLGSCLHALTVPAGRGDTMFCNMYAAYQNLSDGLRSVLDDMRAEHSAEATLRRNNDERNDGLAIANLPPPRLHPVVRIHPDTSRPALYVNPHFTIAFEDMTGAESQPLMRYLCRRATRPENVYRHRWRRGDVLIWDNRCTMHYAVRDYDDTTPRLMHRTTAAGDRPRGPESD